MPFDIGLLKKHPYATGIVVVVGGIVVFYLLSRGGSGASSSGASDYGSALSADTALGQAQAAAAIQTNGQNAQIQQASIAASVANNQTDASVAINNTNTLAALAAALDSNHSSLEVTQSNNDAATLQQQNQEVSNQNIFSLQEAGIENQENQAYLINANDNATSLAGLVDTLNAQGQIASQTIDSATGLAVLQENDFEKNATSILPTLGKQYNSALDANNALAGELTILSGGNPTVAATGVASSVSTATSGNSASASKTASIFSAIGKIGASIGSGLFAGV